MGTVDGRNPALPIRRNISYFPHFRVLKAMQDFYALKLGSLFGSFFIRVPDNIGDPKGALVQRTTRM